MTSIRCPTISCAKMARLNPASALSAPKCPAACNVDPPYCRTDDAGVPRLALPARAARPLRSTVLFVAIAAITVFTALRRNDRSSLCTIECCLSVKVAGSWSVVRDGEGRAR